MLRPFRPLGVLLTLLALGLSIAAQPAIAKPAAEPKPNCEAGLALSAAGATEEAKEEYVRVLEDDPAETCARKHLAELNKPAPATPSQAQTECEAGAVLLDKHRDEKALEVYESALKSEPTNACAGQGIGKAGPNGFERAIDDVTNAAPNVLVAIGVLLLAGLLFLMTGHWDRWGRWLRGLRLIKSILKARLDFEEVGGVEVAGKPGPAITVRIKKKLINMREEAIRDADEYDLDLARPREEFADFVSESDSLKTALEKASDISDQAKLVAGLLSIAYASLPIPRFTIGASLEPGSTDERAALTLLLEEKGKGAAATTLTGAKPKKKPASAIPNDPAPPVPADAPAPPARATGSAPETKEAAEEKHPNAADYVRLADPAAVWIQFEIARALKGDPPDAATSESHALTLEGLELYERDNFAAAVEKYERALELNRENWGAYVCLAAAETRIGEEPEQSVRHIYEGLGGLERTS